MSGHVREAFSRFIDIPDYYHQPSVTDATVEHPRFDFRLIRVTSRGDPDEKDLYNLAHLSNDNTRIRRANPSLNIDRRAALYSLWASCHPQSFLLLERTPPDKKNVSIIGNTAILSLSRDVFERIQTATQAVVDLRPNDICSPTRSSDVLLFDTWVIHNDYQDYSRFHFGRKAHGGFGNALPLRHLSLFWSCLNSNSLKLYAEADSQSMEAMLPRLMFHTYGETKVGLPLMEFLYPLPDPKTIDNALQHRYVGEVIDKIEQVSAWPLVP